MSADVFGVPPRGSQEGEEERFTVEFGTSLEGLEYLQQHDISELLQDAVGALLKARPGDPAAFLSDFLANEAEVPITSRASLQVEGDETRRLLVLTDVGEEVDDEAALWLMMTHLAGFQEPRAEADVVFVTGRPLERAMRWADILNSLGRRAPAASQVRYFVGPETPRHMRYCMPVDVAELVRAGIGEPAVFDGGNYDIVLQISPLGGFSDDFVAPPKGPEGALGRIFPRSGAHSPALICVGAEGSTNFPRDALHCGFKAALVRKGFTACHIEKPNYVNWNIKFLEVMPPRLVELVLEDEWNKAIGRIPPSTASLFVRFRVNTSVNYDVVGRAFAAFESGLYGDKNFARATTWWGRVASDVRKTVMERYVQSSRRSDDANGDQAYSNPSVSSIVQGMNSSWESVTSVALINDMAACGACAGAAFSDLSVDEVMGWALTLMTGRLLRVYAYSAYTAGGAPQWSELLPYLQKLDFHSFPTLHIDVSSMKKELVGNPMYDPAGMLVALVALACNASQVTLLAQGLADSAPLLSAEVRAQAMHAGYQGVSPPGLKELFFPKARGPRLLVFTDTGDEAGDEVSLWLLTRHLEAAKSFEADVVFVTGSPVRRAMRWASILNSLGNERRPGAGRVRYWVGPETARQMRYVIPPDDDELKKAGLEAIHQSSFDGGTYDVVLQIAPLTGFSDEFSPPPDGVWGALGRVFPRLGSLAPLYIVVGAEGSVNFPIDALHSRFKCSLVEKGFAAVHVDKANFISWDMDFIHDLPHKLQSFILDDEWNKATGRLHPSTATLYIRFRLATNLNYDSVTTAWARFAAGREGDEHLARAEEWWESFAARVKYLIMKGYVAQSRLSDDAQSCAAFGNPTLSSVTGMGGSWLSVMSPSCIQDMIDTGAVRSKNELAALSVDKVMGLAITELSGKMLKMYAHHAFAAGLEPCAQQVELYAQGSGHHQPLDFYNFPRIPGDFSALKKLQVGSVMHDPIGMLLALLAISAAPEQVQELSRRLCGGEEILDAPGRMAALRAASLCESPSELLERFFPRTLNHL